MAGATTTKKKPQKIGRPSKYSEGLADEICAEIAEGKSLRSITKRDDMPSMVTVFSWIRIHEPFLKQYMRAKQESADAFADDIQDIADDVRYGRLDPNAGRVAGDLKKWSASKLKPSVYGDKVDLTTNGKDLPTPILGSIPKSDTIRDVMEGEIVDSGELSETPKSATNRGFLPTSTPIEPKKTGNIINDIIGDDAQ